MNLRKIAARMSSTPKIIMTWFEGGSYSPTDIVGSLPKDIAGPVWVGFYGFGWVMTEQDPQTISTRTPVIGGVSGDETWGHLLEDNDVKEATTDMKPFPSVAAFAADDQTIRWMCSYEESERDGVMTALKEAGFEEAAAHVPSVEF